MYEENMAYAVTRHQVPCQHAYQHSYHLQLLLLMVHTMLRWLLYSFLSRFQQIISDIDIHPFHEAKLLNSIVSSGLPRSLFFFNFPVVTTTVKNLLSLSFSISLSSCHNVFQFIFSHNAKNLLTVSFHLFPVVTTCSSLYFFHNVFKKTMSLSDVYNKLSSFFVL